MITYDLSLILGKGTGGNSLNILKCMAEYRRDKCLTHPLCYIVLSTKWKKFGCPIFLINLLLFLLFLVPLTYLHVLLEDTDHIYCSERINGTDTDGKPVYNLEDTTCFIKYPGIQATQYAITIFGAFQIIKEAVQCYFQRVRYFTSVSSWLDLIGVGAALVSVIPPCECKWGRQKEFAAFGIFTCWINLILYFRRLPFYGKYVIMLYCMFKTLLKVLVLFLFFIIAFGSTFHIILDKEPFTSLPTIFMNTFIMTLGELNYTDVFMPWSELFYPSLVNILMVMFCLTMPIIMMNMLVGLAVGDIDKIERNALIDRYIMQVELLIDLENALPSWLLQRFHLSHVIDFPNRDHSIPTKIFDALVGFGSGNDEDAEDDNNLNEMPEISKIHERLEDQAAEMEDIHKTVTTILDLLRAKEEAARVAKVQKDEESMLSSPAAIPGLEFLPSFTFGNKKVEKPTN